MKKTLKRIRLWWSRRTLSRDLRKITVNLDKLTDIEVNMVAGEFILRLRELGVPTEDAAERLRRLQAFASLERSLNARLRDADGRPVVYPRERSSWRR